MPAAYDGITYAADRYSSGGSTSSTTDPIAGTTDDALFQSERYGSYAYQVPVTEAEYRVVLHFAEIYWTADNERSFNLVVEGQPILSGFDLHFEVGHDNAYSIVVDNVGVSDGNLSIELETLVDNGTLSGFAVYSATGELVEGSVGDGFCPSTGTCQVLPLGDSITDGFGTPGGYRIELFRTFMQINFDMTFVGGESNGPATVDGVQFPSAHEGHSGWTISQINSIVNSGALNVSPHIILLHIGTNDMISSAASAPANLEQLLDNIIARAPNALLVVSNIIPLPFAANSVSQYNAQIPAIVQQRASEGANIIFVDQFTGFPSSELDDGVHPNPAGYERMANKWFDAILDYL